MTEFTETAMRVHCRLCKSKLPAPVSNPQEAFCTRGCHASFYRHRCRVCEGSIVQPQHGTRLICKKAKCRAAWKAAKDKCRAIWKAAKPHPCVLALDLPRHR
jgi:hypothetical protein